MQRINNMGSLLQAYALKRLLETLENQVEFIDIKKIDRDYQLLGDYKQKFKGESEQTGLLGKIKKIDKYTLNRLKIRRLSDEQSSIFEKFRINVLNIDEVSDKYDLCVIGSDEVFNCLNAGAWGFTSQLFGNVVEANNVITYAASCGSTKYDELPLEVATCIRETFKRISAFSARDMNTHEFISKLTTTIVVTGVSIIKFVFNFIVAIIVSIYLLIDKKMQSRGIKRTIYAIFDEERANKICAVIKRSIHIFSNFFDGKMIDSLIIGALTFVSMMIISLFGVPGFSNCALLVGIVVGITNMIPYFGPFLGGIPSILLLCIYSLNSALIFAILIIIIQQLDGNLIGPKILGNSTGLRPLWIIFAITLGGWIAGIPGMLLGVPCVAVIAGLLEDWVNERLEAKNIDMPIVKNEKVREAKEEMKEKEESK